MRLTRLLLGCGIVVGLFLAAAPAFAATLTVDTTTDGLGVSGCSLREAIASVNAGADTDGCVASGAYGFDVIELPTGTYELTTGSNLVISAWTLIRPVLGNTVTIQSAATPETATWRVFKVASGVTFNLRDMTIRNGVAGDIPANELNGGCILVQTGAVLNVSGATITECRAGFEGGGIYGEANSTVAVEGSSIVSSNQAGDDGGGIKVDGGTFALYNSTVSGNRAHGLFSTATRGGGIDYVGTFLTITGSSITGNNAIDDDGGNAVGGGIYAEISGSGVNEIRDTIISGNTARGSLDAQGGGVYKVSSGYLSFSGGSVDNNLAQTTGSGTAQGGGIFGGGSGEIDLYAMRVQKNSVIGGTGGGIYFSTASLSFMTDSCIVGNSDVGVYDSNGGIATFARTNWWGTTWGPRIEALTGSLSALSNGDSINGNGANPVDVAVSNAGTYTEPGDIANPPTGPTGNWKTIAQTGDGTSCMTCTLVSSDSHSARVCS